MQKKLALCCLLGVVSTTAAMAADWQRLYVEQSVEINAPVSKVWEVVGRFDGLHNWHPAIKATYMPNPVTRVLDLGKGLYITEQLESKDDSRMMLNYRIVDMSTTETIQAGGKNIEKKVLPVNTYSSKLSVMPQGNGSQVTWAGDFYRAWLADSPAPAGMGDEDATKTITDVYQTGLNNLKTLFSTPNAKIPQTPASTTLPAAAGTGGNYVPAPPVPPSPPTPPAPPAPGSSGAVPQTQSQSQGAVAPEAPATPPPQAAAGEADKGKSYDGHVQCTGGACKIDLYLTKGFRTFSQCQVCHGIDGNGSTIAPSLMQRLQQLDHATFIDRVTNGYKGQIGVMPAWKENPNVMNNIENLYAYLKARSDGVIPAGPLDRF